MSISIDRDIFLAQVANNALNSLKLGGSTQTLGAEGREFESRRPDHLSNQKHTIKNEYEAVALGGPGIPLFTVKSRVSQGISTQVRHKFESRLIGCAR